MNMYEQIDYESSTPPPPPAVWELLTRLLTLLTLFIDLVCISASFIHEFLGFIMCTEGYPLFYYDPVTLSALIIMTYIISLYFMKYHTEGLHIDETKIVFKIVISYIK